MTALQVLTGSCGLAAICFLAMYVSGISMSGLMICSVGAIRVALFGRLRFGLCSGLCCLSRFAVGASETGGKRAEFLFITC